MTSRDDRTYFFIEAQIDELCKKTQPGMKFNNPVIGGTFKSPSSGKRQEMDIYLELNGAYLLLKKSRDVSSTSFITLPFLKLKEISREVDGETLIGFQLSNARGRVEFVTQNHKAAVAFLDYLRRFCVRSNFAREFETVRVISQGINSKLFHVRSLKSGLEFAVKVFDKKPIMTSLQTYELVRNEVMMLRSVDHEHIVRLEELYEGENYLYAVMELFKGPLLFDRIKELRIFSEAYSLFVIKQVLLGLDHIHSRGLVHRDVKLENILFKSESLDSKLSLIDLGFCVEEWRCMKLVPTCGTPGYAAPEILRLQNYNRKVDVFSAGVVFYMMST